MNHWQYAQVFLPEVGTAGNNGLVAAGSSADTLLVLYRDAAASAKPLYSYLTSAPRARSVAISDNYIIAFNVLAGSITATTRVQWCARGSPSNWTGEGSGFEDLLDMRGDGKAVVALNDKRIALFTEHEIWVGHQAPYPAQWVFSPLETAIGCAAPQTIVDTELGVFFLGTDTSLRLLPRAGGQSVVVSASVAKELRRNLSASAWGIYDPRLRLYHLFHSPLGASVRGLVVNVDTGEWAYEDLGPVSADSPQCGLAINGSPMFTLNEGLYFGNSVGTVFSSNSLLAQDTPGSVVTSTWRSPPLASDIPGNYKQLTQVDCDYRATSRATVTLKVSQDGGNSYGYTAIPLSLTSAPTTGRATSQLYAGGGFPAIELTSTDTGYELHRLDVTMNLGGRR
jgi:hypothetical protein